MSKINPYVFLSVALVCNALANILIKYSMSRSSIGLPDATFGQKLSAFLSPVYILAIVLFGLNLVAHSVALKTLRISIAYPLMVSVGYCLILLAGWFVFNERLSPAQYAGISLILGGIWLVVR